MLHADNKYICAIINKAKIILKSLRENKLSKRHKCTVQVLRVVFVAETIKGCYYYEAAIEV